MNSDCLEGLATRVLEPGSASRCNIRTPRRCASKNSKVRRFCCTLALVLTSCGVGSKSPSNDAARRSPTASAAASPEAASPAPPSREGQSATESTVKRDEVVLVVDPAALAEIDQRGVDFGSVVDGSEARGAHNDTLSFRPAWRSIADVLESTIRRVQRSDRQAGVDVATFPHRLFDVRWLSSATAYFELVAVANRIDRRPFHPSACGETRLVYRLAYRKRERDGGSTSSRLPMTVNVELRAADRDAAGSCRAAAARWFAPKGLRAAELGAWLSSDEGPLNARALAHGRLVQVVINMQSVRWPSAVRPDLGGHAEYVLRAFGWDPAKRRYEPRPLENTPDTERLKRDRKLRAELLAWLRDPANLVGIDEATVAVPDKFLATQVVSVTPRGFARRANRPYRQLFEPKDFADLKLDALRFARSPEAFVRRLDDATCSGCHQRRSIAGFHLLGEDPPDTAKGNALALSFSPHVAHDLERRRTYLGRAFRGEPLDDARPFAERASASDNGYGAPCGLGDPGFASWTCAAGLRCDAYEAPVDEQVVGVCLPESRSVGDPCNAGRVSTHDDAHLDRVSKKDDRSCSSIGGVCETASVGFPGGMCATGCGVLPPDGACGDIAILSDFNLCIARGRPFPECLANHVRPGGLRACAMESPCRDDYICARTSSGEGACIPPYFLFQLRVDGHPH